MALSGACQPTPTCLNIRTLIHKANDSKTIDSVFMIFEESFKGMREVICDSKGAEQKDKDRNWIKFGQLSGWQKVWAEHKWNGSAHHI